MSQELRDMIYYKNALNLFPRLKKYAPKYR